MPPAYGLSTCDKGDPHAYRVGLEAQAAIVVALQCPMGCQRHRERIGETVVLAYAAAGDYGHLARAARGSRESGTWQSRIDLAVAKRKLFVSYGLKRAASWQRDHPAQLKVRQIAKRGVVASHQTIKQARGITAAQVKQQSEAANPERRMAIKVKGNASRAQAVARVAAGQRNGGRERLRYPSTGEERMSCQKNVPWIEPVRD